MASMRIVRLGGAALLVALALALVAGQPARAALGPLTGKIAFAASDGLGYDIYAMNAGDSSTRRLTNVGGPLSAAYAPAWSPTGAEIAYVGVACGTWSCGGFYSEISVIGSDGTYIRGLAGDPLVLNGPPAWSPDGEKIAFSHWGDPLAPSIDVYTMNASDGTDQTNLTFNDTWDGDPTWSPDGTEIAFASDRDGNDEIYAMSADGTGQTRLTSNSAWDGEPAWSPDGEKIAFASDRDGNGEIYAMNADGTDQTRLTTNDAWDDEPDWSPDGTEIAFASDRESGEQVYGDQIYAMNADGSEQTRLIGASDCGPVDLQSPAWQSGELPLDTTPPDTLIVWAEGAPNSASATFGFCASEPGSAFECRLDESDWTNCSSPKTYADLTDRSHTFSVRATDGAGNTDPTPATLTWTVDIQPPDTAITAQPADPTNSRQAGFEFSSSEPGSTFQCDLDGLGYESCESPREYAGLADGSHTFSVSATDQAANTDPTAATYTWTVDTTAATPPPPDTDGPVSPLGTTSGALLDKVGPTVRISRGKVRLTRRGLARVRVSCPASEPDDRCTGMLTLKTTIHAQIARRGARKRTIALGQGSFSIARGWTAAVKVRLSRKNRRLVKTLARISVEATAEAHDAAGNSATATRTLVLEAPPVWG